MKYTIYQITNLIDGKVYVGCHKTDDIDDGYMGSGKYLKRAIAKHGIENFHKDILGIFDTLEDMLHMEAVLVNEEFVERKDTYNLKIGGEGGFDHINDNLSEDVRDIRRKNILKITREQRVKGANKTNSQPRNHYTPPTFTFDGRQHREESKKKIGEAASKHQMGSGNSQYGMMWITNEVESKKIPKGDPIPEGYRKGRKQKSLLVNM